MSAALLRMGLNLWAQAYLLSEAEPVMFRRLPALLPRLAPGWPVAGTVGVDVGASMGVYSLAMSGWCERVLALEPNSEMAGLLRRVAIPRVEIVEAAASNRDGEGVLTDASASGRRRPEARIGAEGAWRAPCRLVRLETLLRDPVALVVKIDVEGHEAAVIEGMDSLLNRPFALLMVEIEERHNPSYESVFEILAARGFTSLRWSGGRLIPATVADVPRAEEFPGGRFARLNGYRPNFVFLKQGAD